MKGDSEAVFLFDLRSYRLSVLCAVALAVSACAGFGKRLESPRVSLANVQLESMQGLETVLRIELRVLNGNEIPLVVKGMECELEINGRHLASGVSDKRTEIPAYGTAIVPVALYSSVLDLVKGAMRLKDQDKVKYELKGHLHLEAGILAPSTIPFKSAGEVSFPNLPTRP